MPTTDNTSSNKTRNVRAKVIYANYEIARQALLEGQSIRMPSAANADASVLAAKAIGPIQFTPAEIASVLQSASIFPPTSSATAPGPVRDLSGTAGDEEVVLTWTAPSSNGGSPITSYTVSWEWEDGSGSRLVSSPATTTTIEELQNGIPYTFSVVATNSVGVGLQPVSVTVTPAPLPILGYYVSTFAGDGTESWLDATGTNAQFNNPYGVGAAVDGTGAIYIADTDNHRIRKIGTDRQVTTIAGRSTYGTNDGVGTNARFEKPRSIALDGTGTIYVADTRNSLIRKIGTDGQVTTYAGQAYNSGTNDGIGTNARFRYPYGIAVDGTGTIYVADTDNHRIRTIGTDGQVTTIAGDGTANFNEDLIGTNCQFNSPRGVAVDGSGTIYVADSGNNRIRTIGTDGQVTTFAGNGTQGSSNATGTNAQFRFPNGVAVDASGMIYVADTQNYRIRTIGTDGQVTTIAGSTVGFNDGVGTNARFYEPRGVAVDGTGTIYVADEDNHRIRKITPITAASLPLPVTDLSGTAGDQQVELSWTAPFDPASTLESYMVSWASVSGDSSGSRDLSGTTLTTTTIDGLDNGTEYTFSVVARNSVGVGLQPVSVTVTPAPLPVLAWVVTTIAGMNGEFDFGDYGAGAAVDANGTLYVTDYNNDRICKIQGTNVTTYANLIGPVCIAIDRNGILYVADYGSRIRTIGTDGEVTTIAGDGDTGTNDGTGTNARFYYPSGITVDVSGTVYVADCYNDTIRKIRVSDAYVSTYAGKAENSGTTDGFGTNALFDFEDYDAGVAVDANGILYVTDTNNELIRRIGTDGYVSTIAGDYDNQGTSDGFGTNAQFNFGEYSRGIAVDKNGILYVADTGNYTIRRIGMDGYVSTIAGQAEYSGSDDGTGTNAQFYYPTSIAIDRFGNLYIGDLYNNLIRKITPITAASLPLPVTDLSGTAGDQQVELSWTAPFDPASTLESYTVSWTPASTDGSGTDILTKSTPNTTTTITGLTNASEYTFSVVATNSVGVGLQPVSVTVTPAPLPILGYYVSTFAGNQEGFNDGTGTNAQFDEPYGIGAAVDGTGAIYVADQENHRIRRIGTNGEVTTIAGGTEGFNDATGTNARFDNPTGLAVDASGTIYVADKDNYRIRKIGTNGEVTTFAGSTEGTNDATGTNAQFRFPRGVTVDGTGTVYVADTNNHRIRKIGTDGQVTTIAGSTSGTNDATGTNAQFDSPRGVGAAVDGTGTIYVADTYNHRIRKITAAGVVTTYAGDGTIGTNNGVGTNAQFYYPRGVAVDGTGTIYVADSANNRIRKITPMYV